MKETPPEFRVQMHDITIQIGEPATFDCQVLGYPKPEVYWTKVILFELVTMNWFLAFSSL